VTNSSSLDDELLKSEVTREFEDAKQLAKSIDFEKVKNGEWFIDLLKQVVKAYDRNARAAYLQKKYPGLSPDEIADILSSVTVRYATIAGAVVGLATSADEIAALGSGGLTVALFVGSIGAEMLYLSSIQMRLVLDLSLLYDLQLDPEDPEDMLMIFGYALGVAPTDIIGKGLQVAARTGTTRTVKAVIRKETLAAVTRFARKLGAKVIQRTIIKFAIPVVSVAVGSSYNYVTTKSVGQIAKAHFKNKGKVTDELRAIISKQNTYDLAIPAAVMFMAQADGSVSSKEKDLYRAMLSRMSFEQHAPADFNRLIRDEQNVLDAISNVEDVELRNALIELLTLMAIYDGKLADGECEFLTNAAERLGVSLDMEQVEKRAKEAQIIVRKNLLEKTGEAVGNVTVTAVGTAGQAASRLKNTLGNAMKRQDGSKSFPTSIHVDPVERLKKLKQMLEAGLITQAEFDTKKVEILSSI
jgi:uncharacterized tellurite resistance protein B-like protein